MRGRQAYTRARPTHLHTRKKAPIFAFFPFATLTLHCSFHPLHEKHFLLSRIATQQTLRSAFATLSLRRLLICVYALCRVILSLLTCVHTLSYPSVHMGRTFLCVLLHNTYPRNLCSNSTLNAIH
jgi:hypothetical protein